MFHFIKDRINISQDMSHIEVTCFSCHTRGHLARDCNQIHYVPQKMEVIQNHLKRQEHFRSKFRRKNRERFWALTSIPNLSEAAEMMQEDYSDYTISDEELSQDSLDIILERNLIIIPGAEMNDMKTRKVERRNKSNRYSAQQLIGEIINANSALATRFSYTSQTVTATKEEHLSSKAPAQNDLVFFSIDKVENFEVYYPQFNIRTMIQKFEKERLKQILGGSPLGLKALKNFGSLLKDANRRGTRSPVYFANLQRKNTPQRKRKSPDKSQEYISYSSLGKQMQQAIIRQKSLKKQSRTKTFEEDSEEAGSTPVTSNNERPEVEGDPDDPEVQAALVLKKIQSTKEDGTMSKKELHEDKKTVKSKQQVERMEHLVPKTMTRLKLDHSGTMTQLLNSSPRLQGVTESPPASPTIKKKSSQRSSKKGTTINIFHTRNSLDDKLIIEPINMAGTNMEGVILQAMIKEGIDAGGQGGQSTRRRRKISRAYSLEKLDEMKKTIHKFMIPKIIKSIVEANSPVSVTKTANFGL